MSQLADRVKITLDESRMLVLGTQILVGFQMRGSLETGADNLSSGARYLYVSALALLVITLILLLLPAAYQQIVARGQATRDLQDFSTRVMALALLPFALALAMDLYVVFDLVYGFYAGLAASLAGGAMAIVFWYGVETRDASQYRRVVEEVERMARKDSKSDSEETPLHERINQVLTEARMVLPGAQALLGFGLIATFMSGFDKLPESSKLIHLASVLIITLATILLMMPAAYHRIVERGQDTERFQKLASRMLLAAMIVLALGITLDAYVVLYKVTGLPVHAAVSSILLLALFYGLWFGYTLYRRGQLDGAGLAARTDQPVVKG